MYKFASQCTIYFLKFNKIPRTEYVNNEFTKFAFVICALVMYAFAKCVQILQIRAITKLIYNTIRISNKNVNKINALDKSVYLTILNNNLRLTDIKILWGKISQIQAKGIGSVSILFKDTNKKAILQNCLFVSEFDINLILVNLLTEKRYKIISDTKCKTIEFKNNIILTTINNNKLYTFPIVK